MRTVLSGFALIVLAAPAAASAQVVPGARGGAACVPPGAWFAPGVGALDPSTLFARAARASVVLLGETHENPEHHRWQLQALAALHALRPRMVIGFEMFPRRVQEALDRWVAGELSVAEFLAASDWHNFWRFDPELYLPLFHFARMNRIPMLALNVEERLARAVAARGFDAVAEAEREGVTRPAAPAADYLDFLLPIYREHERRRGQRGEARRDDPDFLRFVETQQLWDRAMAQALQAAAARPERPLVVGILGRGHVAHGYGVPHQLRDLGVSDVVTLLPWDGDRPCGELVAGLADAVFGVAAPAGEAGERPRLGVRIERASEGVRVARIEGGSVAERAGVREGDLITEVAGRAVSEPGEVVAAVRRQAPGTWLPLKVRRAGETLELVARFPPEER